MGLLKQVCLNNIEGIEKCLTSENANTKDSGGNTALHLAAEKGLLPVAKLLVEKGADVNARNDCPGWTPLHFASYEGHLELVKYFVNEAGAIPYIKDNQGDTPETWALEWENYKCAMVISEAMKKWRDEPPPASSSDSSKSSEDEDDGDDDEEMSHWVLPLPSVIPKDLSKPNIPQINKDSPCDSSSSSNGKSGCASECLDSETKLHKEPSKSPEETLDQVKADSETHLPLEGAVGKPVPPDKGLSIVDQIKNSLSPDKVIKKPDSSENNHLSKSHAETKESPSLLPDSQSSDERKYPDTVKDYPSSSTDTSNSLDPISENGAIMKTQNQSSISSPRSRKRNTSDSAPNIDKQLRYISKDKAFSRDLRGSAADIISMTNRYGDLARISKVKEDLLKKLDFLIEEERRQLESDLSKKLEELEQMKRRHREEEDRVEFEISLLSQKLENLTIPPVCSSRGNCFSPPSIEKDITCVGCSRICVPPAKIFQCEEGDILCQDCKDDKRMAHCPECGIQILRGLSRNKALEKLARKHYE